MSLCNFMAIIGLTVLVLDPIRVIAYPHCICASFLYEPVCANNGRTYGNECKFYCEQLNNQNLAIAYNGECRRNDNSVSLCACSPYFEPVCGSDGIVEKTYGNLCRLQCAQVMMPQLYVARWGPCM